MRSWNAMQNKFGGKLCDTLDSFLKTKNPIVYFILNRRYTLLSTDVSFLYVCMHCMYTTCIRRILRGILLLLTCTCIPKEFTKSWYANHTKHIHNTYCTVLIYFVFPSTEALSTDKTLYIVVGGLLGSGTCFRNCEKSV
jgi:hypothetical protein